MDARSFLFTKREDNGQETVFGQEQLEWIESTLRQAADDPTVKGVVIVLSFEWKADREFAPERTLHEKQQLAAVILSLGYNTPELNKFLVMVSGDAHMTAYDSGEFNAYGHFPIFQCSSLNKAPSCKNGGWSSEPSLRRG